MMMLSPRRGRQEVIEKKHLFWVGQLEKNERFLIGWMR